MFTYLQYEAMAVSAIVVALLFLAGYFLEKLIPHTKYT